MSFKVAFIGAGSIGFTRQLLQDLPVGGGISKYQVAYRY